MHQALATPPLSREAAKKRRLRRRRKIVIGLIGAVLLLIIGLFVASKREKPIPVTTEKAVRRTILQTVSATGKIQPETEVKISPEVAGEIIDLPVEDGMSVKKGDLLVKIKPDSYKALLEQQVAAIIAAKATNLQQIATMLNSVHDFKRSQDLFEKKLISEQEYNAAEAAYDVAKNTFESSLHEIERAQASSSQARDQLSKTTIYAPMDGTITVLNSKLGERLVATNQFAGTEVMRVADLSHMQAVVDVNENDVVTVKLGDHASIKIDAYSDCRFKGVELRPGLSCTADIETNVVKDAVAVPMQSVTIRTGDTNLSPEEIENQKQKIAARDKSDNSAEYSNDRLEKQAQKQEHEKLAKVVFVKSGSKAHLVKVTTGPGWSLPSCSSSAYRVGSSVLFRT